MANTIVSTSALLDNQRALAPLIERFRRAPVPHLIDGRPDPGSGEYFTTTCPVDNVEICSVAAGDSAAIDRACQAAARAFPAWRDMAGDTRRDLLHRIADAIEARARDIALVESHDTGQALRFMNKAALRGAENFRFFADRAPGARDGLALPAAEHLNYTLRQPIGPVGVITPWNTPFMLSTWKIAPARAAGNGRQAPLLRVPGEKSRDITRLEEQLADVLAAQVEIRMLRKSAKKGESGEVAIRFGSLDELNGLLERLGARDA